MDHEDLRLAIYHHLADTGRAPVSAALAAVFDVEEDEVQAGLQALHDARHIVLRDGRIVMAHPFAGHRNGARVDAGGRTWWGNCAWDAFGIVAALGLEDATITAQGITLPGEDAVFHVAVPARHWWDDIGFT
jgi:hypothetical protein